MYAIDPGEEFGRAVTFGASQIDQFEPLRAREYPGGYTITRWRFTEKERKLIANGSDLFISQQRFDSPYHPIAFYIEGEDASS